MKHEKTLTRDKIIQALAHALEPLDYIHAFWEGGAVAFDRVDEWSDIDLYVVVDDSKVDDTFSAVENTLRSLSPIKQKYEVLHQHPPGLFQAFYRLEKASKYLIVDLAVLQLSGPEKFLEPEIHGNAAFLFKKSTLVEPPPVDQEQMAKKLEERLSRLQANFDMFNVFVQKEINRGNFLEAVDLYRVVTLNSLIEALRTKHNAFHHDFRMRYIHYELPPGVLEKLKSLSFVKDEQDLQARFKQASAWFHDTMSQIRRCGTAGRLRRGKPREAQS